MNSATQLTLRQVLPHRGHMVLLDELSEYSEEHAVCTVTIRPDTLFCAGALGVPAWVGIEYMAQTACAYAGIPDGEAGRDPRICLLLGARRYRAEVPYFAVGARLRVSANLVLRDDADLAAFDCEIYSEHDGVEQLAARGDIKAYRPQDLSAVLQGLRA